MALLRRVPVRALTEPVAPLSSLQEETVAELRTVESEAASYLDQISR